MEKIYFFSYSLLALLLLLLAIGKLSTKLVPARISGQGLQYCALIALTDVHLYFTYIFSLKPKQDIYISAIINDEVCHQRIIHSCQWKPMIGSVYKYPKRIVVRLIHGLRE